MLKKLKSPIWVGWLVYACYDQDTQACNIQAGCKVTSICNDITQSIHVITSEIFSISGDKRKGIEDYVLWALHILSKTQNDTD